MLTNNEAIFLAACKKKLFTIPNVLDELNKNITLNLYLALRKPTTCLPAGRYNKRRWGLMK